MLRQYFMGLRTVGRWKNLSEHWQRVAKDCYSPAESKKMWAEPTSATSEKPSKAWEDWLKKRTGIDVKPVNDDDWDVDMDEEYDASESIDTEMLLMRKFFSKWAAAAGVKTSVCDSISEDEIHVDWTRVIAPVVEGRIKKVS